MSFSKVKPFLNIFNHLITGVKMERSLFKAEQKMKLARLYCLLAYQQIRLEDIDPKSDDVSAWIKTITTPSFNELLFMWKSKLLSWQLLAKARLLPDDFLVSMGDGVCSVEEKFKELRAVVADAIIQHAIHSNRGEERRCFSLNRERYQQRSLNLGKEYEIIMFQLSVAEEKLCLCLNYCDRDRRGAVGFFKFAGNLLRRCENHVLRLGKENNPERVNEVIDRLVRVKALYKEASSHLASFYLRRAIRQVESTLAFVPRLANKKQNNNKKRPKMRKA